MKKKINEKFCYSIGFILIALIVFQPFYSQGISFVWNTDGVGQYYPAFLYIGQWLRNILKEAPLFDLRIAMGENVIGSLNYYGFGDPLNVFAVFATKENGAYLFSAMILLRMYLAGLAFLKYGGYMKLDRTLLVVATFGYTFSGFALYGGLMYIEFLAPLIYLPLMLCGCEMVWREQKYACLIVSTLYAALSNFCFLYLVGLYLVIYCLTRTFFLYQHKLKRMLLQCVKCALATFGGVILSLPVSGWFIEEFLESTRSHVSIKSILCNIWNWLPSVHYGLKYGAGFLPVTEYWGNISVIVCVVLVASLFLWKNNRQKQCALACWTGSGIALLPITYYLFSGFNAYYDRWHFLLVFSYMVVFAVNGGELIRLKFPKHEARVKYIIAAVCVINISIGGYMMYEIWGGGFSGEFISFDSIQMYVDSPVNDSRVIQADTGLYRISNDSLELICGRRPENIAMVNNYNGLTFWLSVINGNTQEQVNRLDAGNQNGWRSYGLRNSLLYESMAGVKYYLRRENTNYPSEYQLVEKVDFYGDDWEIYRNPYVLPLVYGFTEEYYENRLEEAYYAEDIEVLDNAVAAESVEKGTDMITAEIELDSDGYVLLAIPYSPHWRAYVDGTETEVFRSNILYMTIRLNKGQHDIIFRYGKY